MTDPYDPYGMFGGGVSTSSTRTRPAPAAPSRPAPNRPRPVRPARRPPTPHVAYRGGQPPRPPRPPRQHVASPSRRLAVLLVVFAVLLVAVVARLSQLQVVDRGRLDALGESQVVRTVALPAERGSILDRNGHDLALSLPRSTVWADPRYVEDARRTAGRLAPILGVDAGDLAGRLESDAHFVYLARQVDERVAERVAELGLPGIHLLDEPARFAPSDDLARSVLGGVNIDGVGSGGLERQFDELLAGEPGELVLERDPNGRTIPQGEREVEPATAGDDLVLTLDRGMQHAAEQALIAQVERSGARNASAIVMHPGTGEIYAMANVGRALDEQGEPTGAIRPIGNNLAVTSVYEPGSVNKVITLAAALEEGVVTPGTRLTVPDRLQVSDHLFTEHDPHPTASWTPTDILATSSNIGTILMGRELGPDRIDSYLRRFGFGTRTALDFPHEEEGLLLDVEDWSGTSIGSIPLGQGIAVTALQMLGAYNVIANDGVLVAPRLVAGRVDGDGVRHDADPSRTRRVISEETADTVRDMLVSVVDAGTGTAAAIDGYAVAGKTGTARKPQPTGSYRDAAGNYHYVATFAGFVPAQDPQLSIIVVVDEPANGYYASQVAAPVFAELARFGLRQFRVPPPSSPFRSSVPPPTVAGEL